MTMSSTSVHTCDDGVLVKSGWYILKHATGSQVLHRLVKAYMMMMMTLRKPVALQSNGGRLAAKLLLVVARWPF